MSSTGHTSSGGGRGPGRRPGRDEARGDRSVDRSGDRGGDRAGDRRGGRTDVGADDRGLPLRGVDLGPVRRRDRRGRGLRGPLLPPTLPAYRTRAERFDDLVLDAVERLEERWSEQLDGAEFAVEDVPPSDPAPWEVGGVPLGRCFPADAGLPARVVVYRRPVEVRAEDPADLADLVHDVVVEQVAHLLDRPPEDIDPEYDPER
ncbi:metallopeptidase family protein [Cellulomonas endophytica]|uniref:metallopeptidase family protein n=1 Tax=Cellulomonas endophytica TaxID=2494735 RepID=UPI001F0BC902|nr:metallopeptidase family protein [Cellulomonas endophytica]